MFILQIIGKILKVLRAGPSPNQVAAGITFGMILGMMPGFSLYSLLIILIIFLLNINISGAILGWMIFKLCAYILDPVFHDIGFSLLAETDGLREFWTALYNLPLFPLSNFNNTVVLGSFVFSLILILPVFFLSKTGIVQYREKIEPKVHKLKLVQAVRSSKIYDYYQRVQRLRE